MIEILGLLARRQQDRVVCDPCVGQAVTQRGEAMPGDRLVGDDHGLPAAQQRQDLAAGIFDQSRPDENLIGSVAELDPQPLNLGTHSGCSASGGTAASGQHASAAIARVTVNSGDPSPLSMITSASA